MDTMTIPLQIQRVFDKFTDKTKFAKLSDLGSFKKGKGIANKDLVEEGMPCVTYGQLYTSFNGVIQEEKTYINKENAKNSVKTKKYDILFPGSGETLEEIGQASVNLMDETLYAGGDIIIFTPTSDIDALYLSYVLNTDIFRVQSRRFGQGHSVVHVYSSTLKDIIVPILPLDEQKQIADILSTWDRAIELKENEIRQEKDLLQRAINSLVKENEVLNVQYEKIMLHDCMEFVNGYAFESKNYIDNGDFKVITIGNVQDGMLNIHSNTKFISVLPGNVNKKQKLQKNDILISMTGNVGRVCLVDQDNCVLNQRVGKLIPLDNIHPMYLYYALRSKKFLYKMIAKAQGGAQPNLSTKDIKNHRISVPKLEFQKKIANYLYNLEKQTIFRSREIEKLKLQKKGLMQRLLTGQVRVQV